MRTPIGSFLPAIAIITIALQSSCGGDPPQPELEQAASVVYYMSAPGQLERSMFAAAYAQQQPSEYVSFLFSDMGAAEWPSSGDVLGGLEGEQIQGIGHPMPPDGVAYVPRKPDPAHGKQLVIRADDANRLLIAEGYLDPAQAPVYRREWELARVAPSPEAKMFYQSNRDMGLSPDDPY